MGDGEVLLELIGRKFRLIGSGRYRKTLEHDSLVIDLEKGKFYWNSRDLKGGPIDWLLKVEGYSYTEACKILKSFGVPVTIFEPKKDETEKVLSEELVDFFYKNGINNRDYWYKRAFTDETIEQFKLGYYDGWYTIPVYVDRKLKNIIMRRDYPSKQIKSYKSGVGPLPFNFDIIRFFSTIYFVEGPTDAISMVQNGFPAVSTNSGTHCWVDSWLAYFTHVKRIYILFDNDKAGHSGATFMAKKLGENRTKIYCFWGFPEKYDANDFFTDKNHTRQDLIDLIEKESKFTYECCYGI